MNREEQEQLELESLKLENLPKGVMPHMMLLMIIGTSAVAAAIAKDARPDLKKQIKTLYKGTFEKSVLMSGKIPEEFKNAFDLTVEASVGSMIESCENMKARGF